MLIILCYLVENHREMSDRELYNTGYVLIGLICVSLSFSLICVIVEIIIKVIAGIRLLCKICRKSKRKFEIEPVTTTTGIYS